MALPVSSFDARFAAVSVDGVPVPPRPGLIASPTQVWNRVMA
jgi:hypothetical protein